MMEVWKEKITMQAPPFSEKAYPVFSCVLRAEQCTPVSVTLRYESGSALLKCYVPVQKTRFYFPVIREDLLELELLPEAPVSVYEQGWEFVPDGSMQSLWNKSGAWLTEAAPPVSLPPEGVGAGKTIDVVRKGDCLFAIGKDTLSVWDVSGKPVLCGKLSGMGRTLRQITLCCGGTHVAITAREAGVFLVDIRDPRNPVLAGRYNSVELATGICADDTHIYVANRQYGVEAVDVSDPGAPRQVSVMARGLEVQSCCVLDGRLYAGIWGLCRVEIFDVSDLSHPKEIGSVPLSGKGDGLCVLRRQGRTILYAATGQHAVPRLVGVGLENLNYGQGNGLDIFDVTDPAEPQWLSTSRTDGRFYYPENDNWECCASVTPEDRVLIYLSASFNGLYVFDATDPRRPRRLGQAVVEQSGAPMENPLGRPLIFPYVPEQRRRSPVGGIVCGAGTAYITGALTDLHVWHSETLCFPNTAQEQRITPAGSMEFTSDFSALKDVCRFRCEGQCYAVCEANGLLYAAAGSAGILVLDETLKLLHRYPTEGFCMGLSLRGDLLCAAEERGGLALYRAEGERLTLLNRCPCVCGIVRDVALSPRGRFALTVEDAYHVQLIELSSGRVLKTIENHSSLYHRNLSPLVAGRYLGYYSLSNGGEDWFDFGAEDGFPEPVHCAHYETSAAATSGGLAACGDRVLAAVKSGFTLYDPVRAGVKDLTELPVLCSDSRAPGHPTCLGDRMITCNRARGTVQIWSIRELRAPRLLEQVFVGGCPDAALLTEQYAVVPLGYEGLVRFSLQPYQ